VTIPAAHFATTRWSQVLASSGAGDEARQALAWLCEAYWQPLLAQASRRGWSADAAQDQVQGFFARLLERRDLAADPARGRFRSYLLGAFNNFLSNARDGQQAQKRGGGIAHRTLDAAPAPAQELPPDRAFERDWALALLARAQNRLRGEGDAARQAALLPLLSGGDAAAHTRIGVALGLNEVAVKVAAHRLRRRFREILREEVAATLEIAEPGQIDGELQELLGAVRA
jgi:DNA-directed RNA polymerase specialized sigma24 family protein